jgi:hypothetical protein
MAAHGVAVPRLPAGNHGRPGTAGVTPARPTRTVDVTRYWRTLAAVVNWRVKAIR